MITKLIITLSILFVSGLCNAQGHIDHIKNQAYLKSNNKIDCNNLEGDNLSERICANLAFQKSDSMLTVVYDKVLRKGSSARGNGFKWKLVKLQAAWRSMRDQHCSIIYDSYENCGGCHQRSIDYLRCLKELTDNRIRELEQLNDGL